MRDVTVQCGAVQVPVGEGEGNGASGAVFCHHGNGAVGPERVVGVVDHAAGHRSPSATNARDSPDGQEEIQRRHSAPNSR